MTIQEALDTLYYEVNGFKLYRAGMYGAKHHQWGYVMRDLFLSGIMMENTTLLEEAFRFACYTQGRECNPTTGEEPGRIIHELEEVEVNGLKTRYNSCDSTLLFLIVSPLLPYRIVYEKSTNIQAAKDWLIRHINDDGLFIEDPKFCGSTKYALKTTYWKDASLIKRKRIHYPVSFFLIQAQVLKALRVVSANQKIISRVNNALSLWRENPSYVGIDIRGPIEAVSSDMLHMLYYLEPTDLGIYEKEVISSQANLLKTPVGFRTYAPGQTGYHSNSYQKGAIWPFEQYFIAEGAKKHKLNEIADIADQCLGFRNFPEYIDWRKDKIENLGHKLQLWTVAYVKARQMLRKGTN